MHVVVGGLVSGAIGLCGLGLVSILYHLIGPFAVFDAGGGWSAFLLPSLGGSGFGAFCLRDFRWPCVGLGGGGH